ncbi:MAG: hypothetical protein JXD22_11480 [Sedimentisphaerales bacterium]|nr:hypothetical protein [Sedimentisphaerales bacterium]
MGLSTSRTLFLLERINCITAFCLLMVIGTSALIAQSSPKTITPVQAASEPNTSEPNSSAAIATEPNDPAPELTPEQIAALDSPPANTPSEKLSPPTNVWQKIYHSSVDERVFIILRYPYYPGGKSYTSNNLLSPDTEPIACNILTAEPNSSTSPNNQISASDDTSNPQNRLHNLRLNTELCVSAIHQWREINEAPGTALEIIHSIELTRRKSGIYQIQPKLAVNVTRTLGKIGQVNYQFDYISRLALQNLLDGKIDRPLLIRMDKKLSELKSLINLLSNQNDQVGIALGIGNINRQAYLNDHQKNISYSSLTPVYIP